MRVVSGTSVSFSVHCALSFSRAWVISTDSRTTVTFYVLRYHVGWMVFPPEAVPVFLPPGNSHVALDLDP